MPYSRRSENTNSFTAVYQVLEADVRDSSPHVAVDSQEHPANTTYRGKDVLRKKYSETIRDAALSYASAGFPVFPLHNLDPEGNCSCGESECSSPGKHPRYHREDLRNGHKDATTDPERIRRWWRLWPEANIGIPTGERTGLLVLDEDPRHGGDESMNLLTKTHGDLPRTKTTRTGGGGRQIFFIYPPGYVIRNATNNPAPGLDIRGEGGYIVAPPSRTTGAYEALDRSPPADTPGMVAGAH